MREAADALDFERAAAARDRINALEETAILTGFEAPARGPGSARGARGRRPKGRRRGR